MKTTEAKATKPENYTAAMVVELKENAPLTYADAEKFAAKFGKTTRSVIAKAKSEGIEYIAKGPVTKKPAGVTKANIVENIANVLAVAKDKLESLDKASTACLNNLLAALVALAAMPVGHASVDEQLNAVDGMDDFNENGTDATENEELEGYDDEAEGNEVDALDPEDDANAV